MCSTGGLCVQPVPVAGPDAAGGGLATARGIGMFARQCGLTLDLIQSVEMVLADGRIVRANAADEPDLFWAVRGAGASFGVVTGFAQLVSDAADLPEPLRSWGRPSSPRSVSGEIVLGVTRPGQPRHAQAMQTVNEADLDDTV